MGVAGGVVAGSRLHSRAPLQDPVCAVIRRGHSIHVRRSGPDGLCEASGPPRTARWDSRGSI
eukprot:123017-Prorocentrum_lima.AAC.1